MLSYAASRDNAFCHVFARDISSVHCCSFCTEHRYNLVYYEIYSIHKGPARVTTLIRKMRFSSRTQSRTKLLENVFPLIRTSVRNKTISKTTDLRSQIPFPQVKVAFYKRSRIWVALEHTTTLLPRGGGKGKIGTARMFSKILWKCAIFSRVLSQIVAILISC